MHTCDTRGSRPLVTIIALFVGLVMVQPVTVTGQQVRFGGEQGAAPTQEARPGPEQTSFPVQARVLVDGAFQRCEGIAFNGEGDLYVAGNGALWRVSTEGEVTQIAELYSNLGLAPIGDRDILMADFGPTNRFNHGPNTDGIVWRITPEGDKTRVVDGGLGDPNALWVRSDGNFDHLSIYATSTRTGKVWVVQVGIGGAPLHH
jgi:sugar lactone lactonase YvrE